MIRNLVGLSGGYALRQRDLRILYAVIFLSFLGVSITFPLRLLYAQQHGATPAELGIMAAAFIVGPLIAQFPLGWLVDRWGRVPVLMVALVSHALISLLYIFFTTPIDLIALRFLEGISTSAFQPAESAYIADVTPEEHRSEAYGVLNASLMGGLLIGPLVGGVVGQHLGFTAAFILNVAVEVLALLLAWSQVREPPIHSHLTEGQQGGSWRRLVSLPLLGAYAAFFSMQVVIGMFTALWTIWLHDIGGSYTYIGFTMTVFALPQIFLSAIAGRAADRWGRGPVLLAGSVIIGGVYASYGFITDLTLIVALGVFEGLIFMFVMPAGQALLADASPAEARGRAQGIAGAVGAVGGAIAAFASLPLYHASRPVPFVGSAVVVVVGSYLAAAGAFILSHRRTELPEEAPRAAAQ